MGEETKHFEVPSTSFEVHVRKEDFKFHAAHFVGKLIVSSSPGETLRGDFALISCLFWTQPSMGIENASTDTTTPSEFGCWDREKFQAMGMWSAKSKNDLGCR